MNVGCLFNILIIWIYFQIVDLSTLVAGGKKIDSTCQQLNLSLTPAYKGRAAKLQKRKSVLTRLKIRNFGKKSVFFYSMLRMTCIIFGKKSACDILTPFSFWCFAGFCNCADRCLIDLTCEWICQFSSLKMNRVSKIAQNTHSPWKYSVKKRLLRHYKGNPCFKDDINPKTTSELRSFQTKITCDRHTNTHACVA